MKRHERAVRAELRQLGVKASEDGLAAVVDLAQRLDDDVGERVRATYVRELRLALQTLHDRSSEGGVDDVERFLEGIANTAFRGPGD